MSTQDRDDRPSEPTGGGSSTRGTEFQVVCITREPWSGYGHGRITQLGIQVGGATQILSEEQVIARINAGEKFYVSRTGLSRAYLEISHTHGRAYVKTISDRTTLNNLEALPPCAGAPREEKPADNSTRPPVPAAVPPGSETRREEKHTDESTTPTPPAVVPPGGEARRLVMEESASWWLLLSEVFAVVFLGLLLLILVVNPSEILLAIVTVVGFYWLVVGLIAIVRIYSEPSQTPRVLLWLIGILGILAGLVILVFLLVPALLTLATLVIVVGVLGLFIGVLEIIRGFRWDGTLVLGFGILEVLIALWLLFNPLSFLWLPAVVLGLLVLIAAVRWMNVARDRQGLPPVPPSDATPCPEESTSWWLLLSEGFAAVFLGLLLLILVVNPSEILLAVVLLAGFYWFVMGLIAIVRIYTGPSQTPRVLLWLIGILGILAGIFILVFLLVPALLTLATLVIVVGILGLFIGVLEIVRGFRWDGTLVLGFGILEVLIALWLLFNPLPFLWLLAFVLGLLMLIAGVRRVYVTRPHPRLQVLALLLLLLLSLLACWLIMIFDIDLYEPTPSAVVTQVTTGVPQTVTGESTRVIQQTVTEATRVVPQTVIVQVTKVVPQTVIVTGTPVPPSVTVTGTPTPPVPPIPPTTLPFTHTKGIALTSSASGAGQLLVGNQGTKTITETQGTQTITRTIDLSSVVVFDQVKDAPFLVETKSITGFDQPFDIGIVKDRAFVTEVGKADVLTAAGSVGVIDLKSMTKSTEIDTSKCGQRPAHIAVNGAKNKVYVTLDSSGWVSLNPVVPAKGGLAVIDAASLEVTCVQTPVLKHPFGIAAKSDSNQVYVGDRESDTLLILDGDKNTAKSYALKTDVPGAKGIYHIALSPDEKRLYVVVDSGVNPMLVAYQVSATEPYLSSPLKAGILNTYDGGWVMESKCSGLVYVAATNLDSNFAPLSGLPEVLVLNNNLSFNKILSSADGVGSQPFTLAQDPGLKRIYIGSKGTPGKGDGKMTILSEPSCK